MHLSYQPALVVLFVSVKVVILHQHFKTPESGGAIRSYYLAKALVNNGIQVCVITIHNAKEYKRHIIEGIEVHYLPIAYDNRFGFLARTRSFVQYVWRVIRNPQLFRDADLCYAISTPLTIGLAALWIKNKYNIPYVFQVGDLWPEAPIQLGFIKNTILQFLLYKLEKTIYKNAISIVALSPSIQEAILKKVPFKTVDLIPNMADTNFYIPGGKPKELEKKYCVSGKFVISYIGAIGFANGLDYFIDCAHTCEQAGLPIQFLLCGKGAMLEMLQQKVDSLALKNFSFIPFQDRQGVRNIITLSDAVMVCYRTVPILETGSPNKYFDGLAAGKLILINFGGWIKAEIEKTGCGIYIDPANASDIVDKIRPFLTDRELLQRYQEAARKLGEEKYSRDMLSKKFIEIFRRNIHTGSQIRTDVQ